MNVLLDPAGLARIGPYVSDREHRDTRRYYVLKIDDGRLALIVCRNDLRLSDLAGQVVDAALGWDDGTPGFVIHVGRRHSKLTIHRVAEGDHDTTLSAILQRAPKRDEVNP